MSTNFRSEVFKLCKKLQGNMDAQEIGKMIYDMSVLPETSKKSKIIKNPSNDFAYLAKNFNTEFHGFLFLDDNIETRKLPTFYSPKHLSSTERSLVENGHKTITRFIDLCLSDIASQSNELSSLINPYIFYKKVSISEEASSLLSDDELEPAISAFKNGVAYKALMGANFIKLLSTVDTNALYSLISVLEKEINQSLGENISNDLKEFSLILSL